MAFTQRAYISVASARLDPKQHTDTHTLTRRLHHLYYTANAIYCVHIFYAFLLFHSLFLSPTSFRRRAHSCSIQGMYGILCHRMFSIGAINKNHVVHQSKRSIKSLPRSDSERKNEKIISFHTFSVSVYFFVVVVVGWLVFVQNVSCLSFSHDRLGLDFSALRPFSFICFTIWRVNGGKTKEWCVRECTPCLL